MYFNGAIMTKATGVQNSIRPGSEFSDTFSAIAAGKRTSTLRSAGQFKAHVDDIVEFTGQRSQPDDQRLFARITSRQTFRVPPQGIDFSQATMSLHSAQPPPSQTPAEVWRERCHGFQGLKPVELARKVVIRALNNGITTEPKLAEILQQSPFLERFDEKERDSFVKPVIRSTIHDWRQAATDTAIAAKRLLSLHSTDLPDRSKTFQGKDWKISQKNGAISIVSIKENREILRTQGQEIVTYSPQPHDLGKVDWLLEHYGVQQQQQPSQQHTQQRGRGMSR
jgi:hypothetical protein